MMPSLVLSNVLVLFLVSVTQLMGSQWPYQTQHYLSNAGFTATGPQPEYYSLPANADAQMYETVQQQSSSGFWHPASTSSYVDPVATLQPIYLQSTTPAHSTASGSYTFPGIDLNDSVLSYESSSSIAELDSLGGCEGTVQLPCMRSAMELKRFAAAVIAFVAFLAAAIALIVTFLQHRH